jgi:arginyl-tRNA synthetase
MSANIPDIKTHLADLLRAALASVAPGTSADIHLERPRDASHGDFASNLAMQLARALKENPRKIAERLVHELPASSWLLKADVAGAGFINFTVAPAAKTAVVGAVLACVPPAPVRGDNGEFSKEEKEQLESHLDGLIAAGKDLLGEDWHYVHQHALSEQLADCRVDLEEYGVHFDCWFSERSLYDTGMVARAVAELEKRGHLYEQDGAKWFRSTAFGDEKDRVVQRDNGLFTYFASDIAYHWNKFERGFTRIVDIWGADHHGYIPRVKGALHALDLDADALDVSLVQFVSLFRGTEKVSMSTRAGSFVTLRELRTEVGNDACRFFYLLRKQDQSLDFDLDLAKSQSNDNPVYYIQYAHARVCSVLNQWGGDARSLAGTDLSPLTSERELGLAARLAAFPELIESAARDYAPHSLAFWLRDLAADFHAWYNAERLLVDDVAQKQARLALAVAVRQVIKNGLRLLGVSAPDTM